MQRNSRATKESQLKSKSIFALLTSLIFIFIFSSLVSASLPIEQSSQATINGYDVSYQKSEVIPFGSDYTFSLHVVNQSNGVNIDNSVTSCTLYLYNQKNGSLILSSNIPYVSATSRWVINVNKANFSYIGSYGYLTNCNSTIYGGFASAQLNVQSTGSTYLFLILAGLGILVLMFAFLMENEWLGFIAGVLFIVSGVYVAIYGIVGYADLYTRAIAWVLIGLGFLFEVAAGYKVVENPGTSIET